MCNDFIAFPVQWSCGLTDETERCRHGSRVRSTGPVRYTSIRVARKVASSVNHYIVTTTFLMLSALHGVYRRIVTLMGLGLYLC